MMNMGPADAERLTYWQFTAMRHIWNERHKSADDDDDIEPPDLDFVKMRHEALIDAGIAGTKH